MQEQIDKIQKITDRLMRRAGKKTHVLITPYPISNAVFGEKVEGPILRYMFPCAGIITKGMIRLGKKPKTITSINVKLSNDSGSDSKGFVLAKNLMPIQLDLSVVAGDCLELSITPNEADPVTEVWVSLLWKPTIKDVEAKSYLNEELENDLQERTKALTA